MYLNCPEPVKNNSIIFVGSKYGYTVKNTGKNIVIQGITFKDINIVTWHKMNFTNCTFVNVNYTNYELDNSFDNCVFSNSQVKFGVLFGNRAIHDVTVSDCKFYDSTISTKSITTTTYLHLVGGDFFEIINTFKLTNSLVNNSKIQLDNNNITIKKSKLNNTKYNFHSSIIKLGDCELNNPQMDFIMSKMTAVNSVINNSDIKTRAGYFSLGCEIYLKKSLMNNTNISMIPNSIYSQKSRFESVDSHIENTEINTTDTNVLIKNSKLKNTHVDLFFSYLSLNNSTFYSEGNVNDILTTVTTAQKPLRNNSKTVVCLVKTNYTSENSYLINSTGKYPINSTDIELDTLHKIIVYDKKVYNYGDNLIIKLKDYNGKPVANEIIYLEDLKTYNVDKVKTNENGVAVYKLKKIGNKSFNIFYKSPGFTYRDIEHGITVKLKINNVKTIVKAPKVTNKVKKAKYFKVTVKNKATKKAVSNVKVKIKVYTGKKYKIYTKKTNKKGVVTLNTKNLKIGTHKVVISSANSNYKISAKSMIKIKK